MKATNRRRGRHEVHTVASCGSASRSRRNLHRREQGIVGQGRPRSKDWGAVPQTPADTHEDSRRTGWRLCVLSPPTAVMGTPPPLPLCQGIRMANA